MVIEVRAAGSIHDVDTAAWDALDHGPSPFLRHGFLAALEDSRSIDPRRPSAALLAGSESRLAIDPVSEKRRRSGWNAVYLLAECDKRLVGAVAAFIKTHSYGEYIFDWGWASAAQRAGIHYYPKLVIAAPATPATGPRLLVAPGAPVETRSALIAAVRALADDSECGSIHWLFCTAEEQALLEGAGFFPRASLQFHWRNRGYQTFDDFLAALKSRKRKQLRKERMRAREHVERLAWVAGGELSKAQLDDLDRFYRNTCASHGGRDYLRRGFFHALARELPREMQMVEVLANGGKRVAGALFLETPQALYGRYWGADVHVELLHFETAYYAGIERAIARGLPLFEAGAQGEHKLLRGFEPAPTYSAHWIRHPGLGAAIEEHARLEARAVAQEIAGLAEYGPYRDDAAAE